MPQVSVPVGGRHFEVACEDGQEEHLQTLAAYVDKKVQELVRASRQAADQRLLVMAALLIADELFDERAAGGRANGDDGKADQLEDHAAAALDACARRIEVLAAKLQDA